MNKTQQGFTLIELMIVVTIIGILAAIAIPAYQTYTIRAEVAEGVTLTASAETAASEYFEATGDWPGDNAEAGIAASASITGNYVASVEVNESVITATFGSDANSAINGDKLILTGSGGDGEDVVWTCGGDIDTKYLPSSCRN